MMMKTKKNLDYLNKLERFAQQNQQSKSNQNGLNENIPVFKLPEYGFYLLYRGDKPFWVNNHAEAVMRGLG